MMTRFLAIGRHAPIDLGQATMRERFAGCELARDLKSANRPVNLPGLGETNSQVNVALRAVVLK